MRRCQTVRMIRWDESGSGPPAIFVHGLAEDRQAWDALLPLLAGRFRCIRLDLRGHGESSAADDYAALAMAQDVATVAAEAALDQAPLLIGHSLGAIVATAYATQAPVSGVVNIDQSLRLGDFAVALGPLEPVLRGPDYADGVAAVFAALGTGSLSAAQAEALDRQHRAVQQQVLLGVWDLVLQTPPEQLTALAESLLSAVRVPYLAIHGNDPGPAYPAWLRQSVPDALVEVWDGSGHYPHLCEPQRFADRVQAFHQTST